jgi:hypothetical protein
MGPGAAAYMWRGARAAFSVAPCPCTWGGTQIRKSADSHRKAIWRLRTRTARASSVRRSERYLILGETSFPKKARRRPRPASSARRRAAPGAKLRGQESTLDAALRSAVADAVRLRTERTQSLRQFARVKLDEMMAGRLVDNLMSRVCWPR